MTKSTEVKRKILENLMALVNENNKNAHDVLRICLDNTEEIRYMHVVKRQDEPAVVMEATIDLMRKMKDYDNVPGVQFTSPSVKGFKHYRFDIIFTSNYN